MKDEMQITYPIYRKEVEQYGECMLGHSVFFPERRYYRG